MMIGDTIEQYRIEKKLGEGGVGEVFQATDLVLQRPVAIKRLRPELGSRADVVARFRSEARTLARLNHPNIGTLFHFGETGTHLYMVMEYVEGETLSEILRRRGSLPVAEALPLFLQALDGLGYAHDRGIVHRDIKGSNLILGRDGVLKIMDFGIARVLGSERMTLMGQLVGTPEYMPPEQIRGEEIDARADIYALGSLFYAMLAGDLPFAGGSDFDLMKAKVEGPPEPIGDRAPDLPDGLEAVILCSLEKDRGRRWADTRAFREALEPCLAGLPAVPATSVEPRRGPSGDSPTITEIGRPEDPDPGQTDGTTSVLDRQAPCGPDGSVARFGLPTTHALTLEAPEPQPAPRRGIELRGRLGAAMAILMTLVGLGLGLNVLLTRESDRPASTAAEAVPEVAGATASPPIPEAAPAASTADPGALVSAGATPAQKQGPSASRPAAGSPAGRSNTIQDSKQAQTAARSAEEKTGAAKPARPKAAAAPAATVAPRAKEKPAKRSAKAKPAPRKASARPARAQPPSSAPPARESETAEGDKPEWVIRRR